ncbi:type II toxin-antitoxin system Phd/YefM family antitoxin [Kitasatospora sp. NPDC057500]|uniref:type II toxin-antitoxin system Phd/YefM family antitoxin n=1 Tax=Kitasatospora sp. NPDC057500 TaxID=3346151 RepID=UPI00368E4C69
MPKLVPVFDLQMVVRMEGLMPHAEVAVEPLSEVRCHLARVIDRAQSGTPTIITRRGRQEGVLIALSEYRRLKRIEEALGGRTDR